MMKSNSVKYIFLGAFLIMALGFFAPKANAQLIIYSHYPQNYGNYGYYNPTPPPQYVGVSVSCYATPSNAYAGGLVTWVATASGGNGSYSFSWSGDEGLVGYGSSITKTYVYPGYKSAYVTVTSNGQSASATCSGQVNIYSQSYLNTGSVYNSYYYNNPLSAVCSANVTNTSVGSQVLWAAQATGGSGYYTYSWNGSDGLNGSGAALAVTYSNPGQKFASVTVYSNGQTITQSCSNIINVNGNYVYPVQPVYQPTVSNSSSDNLDIGCYSDPSSSKVDQPITWTAEVSGGMAPYKYSWSGSEGLTGSASSVVKYYGETGNKSAVVTVTSADGKTGTHACSNAIAVSSTYRAVAAAKPAVVATAPTPTPATSNQAAASLFSLNNIPWGWVAVLIIAVLFFTVMYLLFNRKKI